MEGQEHDAVALQDTQAEAVPAVPASAISAASNEEPNEDNVDIEISRSTNAIVASWGSTLPWNPLRAMAPPRSLGSDSYTSFPGPSQAQRSSPIDRGNDLLNRIAHADEGYHSVSGGSHSDSRSVFSSDTSRRFTARVPLTTVQPPYPFDIDPTGPIIDYATQPQPKPNPLVCTEEGCDHQSRTQSEFKKHAARHNKEHVCRVPGSPRAEGFTTLNDLERHQASIHNIRPGHGQSRQYKCFGQNCSTAEKVWPSFDNFKQHLKRMHSDEDMEMLLSKSNMWNDNPQETKALPPTQEVEDGPELTALSGRSDEFHVYSMRRRVLPAHRDPLDWESSFPATIPASPDHLPPLLNDDNQQDPPLGVKFMQPGTHWSKSALLGSGSEYETAISALRSPKSEYSPMTPSNPSLPLPQVGLEKFDNAPGSNLQEALLPSTSSRDFYLGHLETNESILPRHQNTSPQPQSERQSQPGRLYLEIEKPDCHEKLTDSSANSSTTIGDARLDRLCDHGPSEGSAVETYSDVSTNGSWSEDQEDAELPPELVPIKATLVEQLIAGYMSNWRSSYGHVRSRPGEEATVSGQGRRQASRSSRKLAPSSKSLRKRRRGPEQDPNDFPSSDDDCKRRRLDYEAETSASSLFACPYAKYDPTRYSERNEIEANYRGCSSKLLRSISRVKQHLYRVHMQPVHFCPRCGTEFDRQESMITHHREATRCEIRELPFREKMTPEQKNAVHKRAPGKCPRKVWYEIFEILFPGAGKPNSPYAESVSPEAVQDFLVYFQERAPQMLSALILQNTLSLGPYEQSMLDAAVEMAVPRLVQEFGSDFHRLPEDISQASNNFGLAAESSMTVQALPEQANSNTQQIEVGPSMTHHPTTASSRSTNVRLGNQPFAEQLVGNPEWSYHPYTMDHVGHSPNPGSNLFAESHNWNGVPQSQMQTPTLIWPHGAWRQPSERRLQRVAEGA